MRIGIIGAGAVGRACTFAIAMRGCANQVVVLDIDQKHARGVVSDIRYGASLSAAVELIDGGYTSLAGADLVIITAGVNERDGGATNRSDPEGRLRLLDTNAGVYRDIVPSLIKYAPNALILVVTDPPDPLADLTRRLAGQDRVISTGTYLDSLRFRFHLARALETNPTSVEALVIGEHGTSEVFLWSGVRVCGVAIDRAIGDRRPLDAAAQQDIEREVRFANITIIEGIGASQFGIGMVVARIAEIVARDERAVVPIGAFNPKFGVTLSLPAILGRAGVSRILEPAMTADESRALAASSERLKDAAERIGA